MDYNWQNSSALLLALTHSKQRLVCCFGSASDSTKNCIFFFCKYAAKYDDFFFFAQKCLFLDYYTESLRIYSHKKNINNPTIVVNDKLAARLKPYDKKKQQSQRQNIVQLHEITKCLTALREILI